MRHLHAAFLSSFALATTLASGCTAPVASGGSFPTDPSAPGSTSANNTGSTNTGSNTGNNTGSSGNTISGAEKYAGIYQANAKIDFTQPGVLPGIESPALDALTKIGTNPGGAIVEIAQAAGVINVDSTIRDLIGNLITGQLDNYLSDDVQNDLSIIANVAKIAKTTTLSNTLTIHTPQSNGSVSIDLQVGGAGFDFVDIDGNATHVDVTTSAAELAAAKTTLSGMITPHSGNLADADLTFSGGSVTIPVGDYMIQAAGPLILEPLTGESKIDAALKSIMADPCTNLGYEVYDAAQGTYILEDIDADTYTAICNAAVQVAAIEIQKAISGITVSGIQITQGKATLLDISPAHPTADQQSDNMTNGTWDWNFGSIAVPSVLSGARIGTAN